ncbi:MAG: hypothetical protein M1370_03665 [Bacteroidetes bacterium]|nr:hypothetical protein [Bacteroidota bacterium]MCL5025078.1 hypothetical protein [Chloroflexota bacterium]
MAETENKKSKLTEKLARVARGAPSRIGFGAAAELPVPSLVLVAQVPPQPELMQAASSKGADALLLDIGPSGDMVGSSLTIERQALQSVHQARPDVLLGVLLPAEAPADCGPFAAWEEIDYCVAPVRRAPASILRSSTVGTFLSLDLRYPLPLARAASALPVEGIVIENSKAEPGSLTLEDLVRYRLLADVIAKPIIAAAGSWLAPDDLVHLRDQGIEGVLVPAGATASETEARIGAFRQAIDALGTAPARSRRDWGRAVVLPRVGSFGVPSVEEPEEPDEDE